MKKIELLNNKRIFTRNANILALKLAYPEELTPCY